MSKFISAFFVALLVSASAVSGQTVANGHYYGSTLLCDNGYRDTGGRCTALPVVTNGHYYGSTLLCDNGYRDTGGRCAALAAVTNGHYYGSTLLCDNGYGNVGGQCVVVADIPTHSSVASGACAENGSCAGDISEETGRPKTVPVDGYYRKDGTYVRGHYRSTPSKSRSKK